MFNNTIHFGCVMLIVKTTYTCIDNFVAEEVQQEVI